MFPPPGSQNRSFSSSIMWWRILRIDPTRVYVTGLSMGGYGTWRLVAAHPERFAAAVPICGGGEPRRWPTIASPCADLGVSRCTRRGRAALRKPGNGRRGATAPAATCGSPCIPDVEHDSWTQTYNNDEVYDWLLSHRGPLLVRRLARVCHCSRRRQGLLQRCGTACLERSIDERRAVRMRLNAIGAPQAVAHGRYRASHGHARPVVGAERRHRQADVVVQIAHRIVGPGVANGDGTRNRVAPHGDLVRGDDLGLGPDPAAIAARDGEALHLARRRSSAGRRRRL